jgi:uncharacterized protein (TIGR02145 family)
MRNKLAKIAFTAALVLATAFTLSCFDSDDDEDLPGNNLAGGGDSSSSDGGRSSSSIGVVYGESVDYGGETYQTVVIGTQTWFARNLNYNAEGSRCYNDLDSNCEIYGRLYDWETALAVCPSGWHLPSEEEWVELIRFVEDDVGAEHDASSPHHSSIAGRYLTATSFYDKGMDEFGFSALPGGWKQIHEGIDGFYGNGSTTIWWSARENDTGHADCWLMNPGGVFECLNALNEDYREAGADKSDLLSVRCLKD